MLSFNKVLNSLSPCFVYLVLVYKPFQTFIIALLVLYRYTVTIQHPVRLIVDWFWDVVYIYIYIYRSLEVCATIPIKVLQKCLDDPLLIVLWLVDSIRLCIYIYVWKLNQTVLELDFRAVKFLFFPRRDLNPHHCYTAAPFAFA